MSYKTEIKCIRGQNIIFYIGKCAAGNFDIIDLAEENDIWFHISNESSAHVIASIPENTDKKELKYIIKQGAILCKQHSRYKTSKQSTTIVFTKVKHVTKTTIPGTVIISEEKVVHI
uniref:NFACT RNA-binding domain-containing protein n=1 Tax=viral metagenome TaxID=1070528 RepID=A0A6C0LD84_9ZZZZ